VFEKKNFDTVRGFLSLADYYHKFVMGYKSVFSLMNMNIIFPDY
jgi:hypothetical protein